MTPLIFLVTMEVLITSIVGVEVILAASSVDTTVEGFPIPSPPNPTVKTNCKAIK